MNTALPIYLLSCDLILQSGSSVQVFWLRGGRVPQAVALWRHLKAARHPPASIRFICSQSTYHFVIRIACTVIYYVGLFLYKRDPSSVANPEVSSIFPH